MNLRHYVTQFCIFLVLVSCIFLQVNNYVVLSILIRIGLGVCYVINIQKMCKTFFYFYNVNTNEEYLSRQKLLYSFYKQTGRDHLIECAFNTDKTILSYFIYIIFSIIAISLGFWEILVLIVLINALNYILKAIINVYLYGVLDNISWEEFIGESN